MPLTYDTVDNELKALRGKLKQANKLLHEVGELPYGAPTPTNLRRRIREWLNEQTPAANQPRNRAGS